MDTNKLLRDAGINDPAAFQFAAELARQGNYAPNALLERVRSEFEVVDKLKMSPGPADFTIFGEIGSDVPYGALEQMRTVMRIPPAREGALMPDAHHGYAMPIGGVVALENAVSPSFVGYDIACRMMVSILDIDPQEFLKNRQKIFSDMKTVSRFGVGSEFTRSGAREHEVMDDSLWQSLPHLKKLYNTAIRQLGSSGGGNHFFDALIGEVVTPSRHILIEDEFQYLPKGKMFVAIMSHSGSRGAGHKAATHYLKLAKKETKARARGIPKGYEWLSLDSQAGQEYWEVMQLMGRYAQANHEMIHRHFSKESGIHRVKQFQNHHNFAWREKNGVIHRKGATPAHVGQVGIIPGSSGTPSYLVEGLGNPMSLSSSSHGAGRPFSRTEAKARHVQEQYEEHMQVKDILTAGVASDETFMAYKDIERVIQLQDGLLVTILAKMYPKIVIMGGKR